jgi:tetratricopeptide (TPR) repeat protein
MMEVPLRLRPAANASESIAGWLIPSADPRIWARELASLRADNRDVKLFLLPTSPANRTPTAAFVETPAVTTLGPRCIPFQRVADRLFIPADGRLDPAFGDAQIKEALAADRMLLHPHLGLVGFANEDARSLSEYFSAPKVVRGGWRDSKPGVSLGRLQSLEPFPPPDLELMLRNEGSDIGQDSPDELRPTSGVGDAVGKGVGAGFSVLGKGVGAIERMVEAVKNFFSGRKRASGAAVDGKGALRSVREWFEKKSQDFAGLQERRNRAVSKLVDLLKSNPDRGLRYALPINGRGGRGVATPSDRLGRRDVSFSLAGMFGGTGPVDEWALDYELQRKLDAEYRRIARREADLGRYRRAAYIYAQLLTDDAAAAAILKEGRHFHEAAVVYERRLKNLAEAADCYERAGAIEKAVELHRSRGDHVAAGDLYARLGREIEAEESYRFAVVQLLAQEERLKAADLLESKLKVPSEAVDVLESAWPSHWSALACGRKLLAITGRIGDEKRAKAFLATAQDSATVAAASRAALLVESFQAHPSAAVREDAGRRAWKFLSREVSERPSDSALLQLLPRLAPSDRLLVRDAAHFPRQKKLLRNPLGRVVREWRLPFALSEEWCHVVANEAGYYALCLNETENRAELVRGDWSGSWQSASLGAFSPTQRVSTLAVTGSPELLVLLKCTAKPTQLVATKAFADPALPIRFLDVDKPFRCYGLCADELGRAWVLAGKHLHRYDARFHFTRSYSVERVEPLCETPKMAAVGDSLFIADAWTLYVHRNTRGGLAEFPPVVSMAAAATLAGPMIAIASEQSVAFGRAEQSLAEFSLAPTADVVIEPTLGFARDGRLVAADENGAVVFAQSDVRASRSFEFRTGAGAVRFVAGTSNPAEIALFAASGAVKAYSLGS